MNTPHHGNCSPLCDRKTSKDQEFLGPVKIVLVETPKEVYNSRMCGAAFHTLVLACIGAALIPILLFTFTFRIKIYMNLHVLFCSLGIFYPIGILQMTSHYGPTAVMEADDRKFTHMWCHIFGWFFSGAGFVYLYVLAGLKYTSHCLFGLSALVFAICATVSGPFVYCEMDTPWYKYVVRFMKMCHVVFGLLSLISASACVATGVYTENFLHYTYTSEVPNIVTTLVVIYTFIVLIAPLHRMITQ